MDTPSLPEARERAHEALRAVRDALRRERWAAEEPSEGAVLRIKKDTGWHTAVRRPTELADVANPAAHWLMTTDEPPGYALASWDMLKAFIGSSEVSICTGWRTFKTGSKTGL